MNVKKTKTRREKERGMSRRFYTYSRVVEYPWVMRNIKQKALVGTVHEIVDCGINDLLRDPYTHSMEKLRKWKTLEPNGWKVVPDCPDIKKEFNVKTDIDNVEYSKKLMRTLYRPEIESHLPVIQGYYHNPESFRDYGEWILREFGVPGKIGVGTVCKASDKQAVEKTFRFTRRLFPGAWVHAFGLRLQHFEAVYPYINSWDSMSWTFPRGPGRSSRSKLERTQYFADYIKAVERKGSELLKEVPSLDKYL